MWKTSDIGANGNGARTYRVGDALPDGRIVREVDEHGHAVVVQRDSFHPQLGEEGEQALGRLLELEKRLGMGYSRTGGAVGGPKAFRERLRMRLVAGEREADIAAGWERTKRELEAEPPEAAGEGELDQALHLAGQPGGPS